MSKRSTWSIPYVIFMIFFVVLPLVLVMIYAFPILPYFLAV